MYIRMYVLSMTFYAPVYNLKQMVKVAFVPSLVCEMSVSAHTAVLLCFPFETAAVMEVEDYPEHLKAIIAEEEKWEELEKRREQLEKEMCKVHRKGEGPALRISK